jgi:FkbM family methyltransferase
MPQVDFKWLMKRAKNNRSKRLLKQIQRDWKLVREKGQFVENKSFFNIDLGKHKIWMRKCSAPSSVDIYTEIFKENGHSILPQFSGKGDKLIIDAGANEGFYTLKIKQNNPRVKIIAIEANPFAFQTLKKNAESNNLPNVVLINKALAAKLGEVPFEMVPEVSAIGALNMGLQKRPWLKKKKIKKLFIDGITLENLCKDNKIEEIDMLKLDIEGAEIDVLKSSKPLFQKIKRIVVEYHSPEIKQEIKELLRGKFLLLADEKGVGVCGDLYFIEK